MPQNKLSKFFKVATAGDTRDGRVIEEQWLRDAAETYNPQVYGARVNVEHFLSMFPNWDMKAHGDVVALKTDMVEIEGEKRLALLAQLKPLPSLVDLVNSGQKIYTSVELALNFAKTGKAYLVGLAVTDKPASLGTEMLTFAAQHHTHVSDQMETTIELTESDEGGSESEKPGKFTTMFNDLRSKLGNLSGKDKAHDENFKQLGDVVGQTLDAVQQLADKYDQTSQKYADLQKQYTEQGRQLTALQEKYKHMDSASDASYTARPMATGAVSTIQTDC